ncbi:MAG: hypothetical protein AAF909_12330, partial [Pseudomonadota bacterium]
MSLPDVDPVTGLSRPAARMAPSALRDQERNGEASKERLPRISDAPDAAPAPAPAPTPAPGLSSGGSAPIDDAEKPEAAAARRKSSDPASGFANALGDLADTFSPNTSPEGPEPEREPEPEPEPDFL